MSVSVLTKDGKKVILRRRRFLNVIENGYRRRSRSLNRHRGAELEQVNFF